MVSRSSDRIRLMHSRVRARCAHGTRGALSALLAITIGACADNLERASAPPPASTTLAAPLPTFAWQVVVNNGVVVPGTTRTFNSYNQPSLNVDELVVFRARSRGGMGGPAHGVFLRDMAAGTPVTTVFDRTTEVPPPNNLETTFVEPPSFPRIDMTSDTIASRGNHPPVWRYLLGDGTETRAGTTGIYTNPFDDLITGASLLGAVPDFTFFAVPHVPPYPAAVRFDVFPGAPAVTDHATIVFKGNHTVTVDDVDVSKTGVYYRDLVDAPIVLGDSSELAPAGGEGPVILIADSDTLIPGTDTEFGSTAPPSAAGRQAVFAGFDDEAAPTLGGIYLAPLTGTRPPLTPLVEIGRRVPGEAAVFNRLGEGVSFDGRYVAFWGAWGSETTTLILRCPTEGNAERIAYCLEQHPDGFTTTVPVHQGVFVHDTLTRRTFPVAKAPEQFADFVYWNFSGRVPDTGGGGDDAEEPGEAARWRSASFVAVSGLVDRALPAPASLAPGFHAAFKARTGEVVDGAYVEPVDGIYLRRGPGLAPLATLVETGMPGTALDPAAVDAETGAVLPITEMGIERDGFRGRSIVINARMGTEEEGWAGIYLTRVPEPGPVLEAEE